MNEDELKDLDNEVKKLKRIASEWASQLHDLVEDRLPAGYEEIHPHRAIHLRRLQGLGRCQRPPELRRRKAADMDPITGLTRGGASWTPTFLVELDQKTCIGCGRCYKVCPRNVFDLVEREADDDSYDETTRTTTWSCRSPTRSTASAAAPARGSVPSSATPINPCP